ncbi:MAG: hypothetical protein NWE93_01325 [Candidatus Bathyarchaeota archaeon]|nr:hypothetical protein [Candidatus Bathyarchaeota archaeon]
MQFFTVTDQSSIKHKVLVVPLSQTEMNELAGQCQQCMPSISVSSLLQLGRPYVIIDFGPNAWKTAIPLDEQTTDGHPVGDELEIGDILNVVLTSEKNALQPQGDKVYMNVPLEAVLAFSILYSADMAENYALFKMMHQPKAQ